MNLERGEGDVTAEVTPQSGVCAPVLDFSIMRMCCSSFPFRSVKFPSVLESAAVTEFYITIIFLFLFIRAAYFNFRMRFSAIEFGGLHLT